MFTVLLLAATSAPAQYAPPPQYAPPQYRPRIRLELDLQRRAPSTRYADDAPRVYHDRVPPPPRGGRWETVQTFRGEIYLVPTYDSHCDPYAEPNGPRVREYREYRGEYRNGGNGCCDDRDREGPYIPGPTYGAPRYELPRIVPPREPNQPRRYLEPYTRRYERD